MSASLLIPARASARFHLVAAALTLLWLAWLAVLILPLAPPSGVLSWVLVPAAASAAHPPAVAAPIAWEVRP